MTAKAATQNDPCLPIAMPSADTFYNSSKKIFAHYLPTYPLSIDNKEPAVDYYNVNYLSPNGESGKWKSVGGLLRARPLSVEPSAAASYRQANQETEIRRAVARGITGFAFDIMGTNEVTDTNSELMTLFRAAAAVEPRFKIIAMPDMTVLRNNQAAVVQIMKVVAKQAQAYHLSDGRLAMSAFYADYQTAAWWQTVVQQLNNAGIDVGFVPTFENWQDSAKSFENVVAGFGDWGTATPDAAASREPDPAQVHSLYHKIFMMPIDSQQFRPKDFLYWEAGNSASFRNAWMSAIKGGSDWVQIVTWNDFSESGQVSPFTDSTLRRDIGTGYYDLNGFYATWFVTGKQPQPTHDVAYWFYRREPTNAAAKAQASLDRDDGSGAGTNNIEVFAFLTGPATIKIQIGSTVYTKAFSAGIVDYVVPAKPGQPVITLTRNGATMFTFEPGIEIYGTGGLPSGVLDMTYWSGSATKGSTCSL